MSAVDWGKVVACREPVGQGSLGLMPTLWKGVAKNRPGPGSQRGPIAAVAFQEGVGDTVTIEDRGRTSAWRVLSGVG
jgi:hypothetical protein